MARTALALTTAALVVALAPPAGAMIFLHIEQIPGDVTTQGYEGSIDIASLEFSGGQAPPRGGVVKPCAAPSSKTQISTITLQKLWDVASPNLFLAAAMGTVFSDAYIAIVTPAPGGVTEVVRYELNGLYFNSIAVGSSGERPTEVLDIRFQRLTLRTFEPTPQEATWIVCNLPW